MDDLRFLHIPKTAGKTFSYILVSQYGPLKSFRLTGDLQLDISRWKKLSSSKQQNKSLFICHSPLSTGIDRADNATIITLLRDPVNRVKSFCQHVYEGKSSYLVNKYPPYSFEPEDILKKGEVELNNLYVNILVGGNPQAGDTLRKTGLTDSELLEKAWETLQSKITSFGLLEHFDTSLLLFQKQLKWKSPPCYDILNKKSHKRRIQFDSKHIEMIKEMNYLDIALYERAKDHFLQQTASITEEDKKKFTDLNNNRQVVTRMLWFFFRVFGKLQMLPVN